MLPDFAVIMVIWDSVLAFLLLGAIAMVEEAMDSVSVLVLRLDLDVAVDSSSLAFLAFRTNEGAESEDEVRSVFT